MSYVCTTKFASVLKKAPSTLFDNQNWQWVDQILDNWCLLSSCYEISSFLVSWFTQWSLQLPKQYPGHRSSNNSFKVSSGSKWGHSAWHGLWVESTRKLRRGQTKQSFRAKKSGTVCSRFFIFLPFNRLAVCLGLHAVPRYSGYCKTSSQTSFTFWACSLSVSMLHNKEGLSINTTNSNKCQLPPPLMDLSLLSSLFHFCFPPRILLPFICVLNIWKHLLHFHAFVNA